VPYRASIGCLCATGFRLRRASYKGNGLQAALQGVSWERLREMAYEGHGG